MPEVGPRCHELRINDSGQTWRIMYYIGTDAIVILDVFNKTTRTTPQGVIVACKRRLRQYLSTVEAEEDSDR